MHPHELFDPRYQLEAEEPEAAPPLPPRIHEEIELTLRVIDDLAARLASAEERQSSRR
ncbi:hypothetical protein AAFN46_08280 [Pseudomonas sp. CAU 1711]|uniref:hypothetical protein n=1 Tax=Pseudomonas sp. CAU 1711 TaxID=3140356 RepID=UPI0032619560